VPAIPATQGGINKRITVQACQSIKRDPISKITSAERVGGVAQVVEHLPSKVLGSNPTITEKKKKGWLALSSNPTITKKKRMAV
jgi:hypothetical protein